MKKEKIMNIAVRFDNKDREKEWKNVEADCEAVKFMKNYGNRSVTENGAVGYRTTGHELLDLNSKFPPYEIEQRRKLNNVLQELIMKNENMQ